MKRLFIFFAVSLLLLSIVSAQNENIRTGQKLEVKGLSIAITKANSNETQAHLEAVLAKILEKRQSQITKLSNLKVSVEQDATYIEGTGKAKIFGIMPYKKQYKYQTLESGDIVRVKRARDAIITDDTE